MGKTWRDIARPIIYNVLKETKDKPKKEIKKALFDAYPFGWRQYWPYKVWLDEIKIQTRKKKPQYFDEMVKNIEGAKRRSSIGFGLKLRDRRRKQ